MVTRLNPHSPRILEPLFDLRPLTDAVTAAVGSAAYKLAPLPQPSSPMGFPKPYLVPKPPPLPPMPLHPLAVTLLALVGAYEVYRGWADAPVPAIDQPPHGTQVPAWMAEMEEMARIALLIQSQRAAALYHTQNGDLHLARQAQDTVDTLVAQLTTISHAYPGLNRALQAVNVGGNGAAAESSAAAEDGSNAAGRQSDRDDKILPVAQELVDLGGIWRISAAVNSDTAPDHFFDTAVPRDAASLFGKTVIVYGAVNSGRRFLFDEPQRVARELGLHLLLVEASGKRPEGVTPEDFVEAPIFDPSPREMARTVDAVIARVKARGLEVAGVATFYNDFVDLAARTRTALRDIGVDVPGDGNDVVVTANAKHLARQQLATHAPGIAVPYAAFTCAATDLPRAQREAREAFARITGGDPNKRVVMKPIMGAAKVGVRTHIRSADEAAAAIVDIDRNIRADIATGAGRSRSVGEYLGVMMERQLDGPEVDVEVMLGADGGVAFVIGNPRPQPPWQQERGFTLPSALSENDQRALVAGALRALKAMGLRWGNFHVEMILTPEGPRVVEFNTRMGGGPIFLLTRELWGMSLIEQGMRGFLGLNVIPPAPQDPKTLVARYLLPEATGVVDRIDIQGAGDFLRSSAGSIQLKKQPGDAITAAKDGVADDNFGHVVVMGKTYSDVLAAVRAAMGRIVIDIRLPSGAVVRQSGDYLQVGDDVEVRR